MFDFDFDFVTQLIVKLDVKRNAGTTDGKNIDKNDCLLRNRYNTNDEINNLKSLAIDCIDCQTIKNTNNKTISDSSTITDLCNNSDIVDEVELLTLVEEQIPRYKLRFDTITQFSGYENNDFYIKTPLIDSETPIDLSHQTLKETLNYFVLSSDRLSQMTKTYNDIEAVTKLLEEKERDLELAARIGQSLLEQNKLLNTRNEELEAELTVSNESAEKLKFDLFNTNERVIQLRHELAMKNGLLQIYSADIEAQEFEAEVIEQTLEEKTPILTNWEELHKRIGNLEEENLRLKCEAISRANDIELEEKKELQLIHDCAKQLTEANLQILKYQEDVGHKNEDNLRKQEEITHLVTQIAELQRKVRDLTIESESLQNALNISHDCQNELSLELIEIKEKYGTLSAAFHELQTEFKKRSKLNSSHYTFMPFSESLASEIESTLESESSEGEPSLGFGFPINRLKTKSNQSKDDTRCHSPDSVLSGESFNYRYNNCHHMSGLNQKNYYFPNKLQIVKPFEGSAILKQWQKLATPHMGAILEDLPGVPNKAIKDIDKELLDFILNSAKECINTTEISGQNNFVTTHSIFTYTTTSLSQTTESTSVTPSFSSVQLSTGRVSPITTTSLSLFSQNSQNIKSPPNCLSQNDNSSVASECLVSSYESTFGLESVKTVDSNIKNVLNTELSSGLRSVDKISSKECSHFSLNNNNESKTGFDDRSEHSPRKQSLNKTNFTANIGFDGMSSLLGSTSSNGVVMKCNSIVSRSRPSKPNSLSIKTDKTLTINSNERSNISDFSVLKTLRKGGFV